eukprot:2877807-Amphidinium_carterae.1
MDILNAIASIDVYGFVCQILEYLMADIACFRYLVVAAVAKLTTLDVPSVLLSNYLRMPGFRS